MAYTTQDFNGTVYGSASNDTVAATTSNTTVVGSLTNDTSGATTLNVGDTVTYNFIDSGQSGAIAGTYEGEYVSNGTSYPVFTDGSIYYVLGQTTAADYSYTSTSYTPCYVTGTLILTDRGEVAVEDLAIGDMVVTASGVHRPIKWIGHRKLNCRNHPRPDKALPVRISAHAFGENRPSRDLYLSPEHAICVSVPHEVLMPVHALINGSTVQQVEVDEVTYWHVELESHDIILAENMPAESYYEWDNRQFFVESALVELNATPDAPAPSFEDYCRPFHKKGELVENVRAAMKDRAEVLQLSIASRAA